MTKQCDPLVSMPEPSRGPQSTGRHSRFDQQATHFDARAGVPPEAAQATTRTLRQLAALTGGNVVLDVGAGTGNVGSFVVDAGVRYIGLDVSLPMLQVFATKLTTHPALDSTALLIAADADTDWPIRSGSTAIIFFSRSVHLLHLPHVVRESLRVAHPDGAFLVIGRVRRSPESIRALLRKEMQSVLSHHGIIGRKKEELHETLMTALAAHGCHVQPPGPRTVATWTVEESPAACLAAWRGKEGLAGTPLSAPVQHAVLEELERWAHARFADLDQLHPVPEHYELVVVEINRRA